MKTTIILIGMVSLVFLNANHAVTAKQTSFNQQSENEQFMDLVSGDTKVETIDNTIETNYIFDPSTVIEVTKKSLEQEIVENNLVIDYVLETELTLNNLTVKSIYKIIEEDIQITEATALDDYQPLDFDAINANSNNFIEFQNKYSLKQEYFKL